ncbi:hypothetical protein [Comamonas avium]|uniref:Uncharacterized protein n=1 Tax=Comamonas avium TaxID=2762231 RepID=A0ABR8SG36_9BURK|nr:hypothetical protein [Comamonas avium]MBD7962299.1 hypothetical protein [Comamonas avium]
MSHTLVPTDAHSVLPHEALCAHAAHVLRTTAQAWGMCSQQPQRAFAAAVVRKHSVAAHCAGLLWWQVAA